MHVITNPIGGIPKLKNSHVRGWSLVWAEQLGADLNLKCSEEIGTYDRVYIEHGVNYGGSLNLFGGASEELFNKINNVALCSDVVSLDWDMPNWGEQFRGRIGNSSTFEGFTHEWCDLISDWCKSVKSLKQENLKDEFPGKFTGISLGDSHTPAFSRKDDIVLRENGKTLFGTLKRGLKNEFHGLKPFGEITFCMGSIDIRHHLLRHDLKLKELLTEYVKQGNEIASEFKCSVSFAAPVPVEYEGRKIPKTGFYKGTPFFGSREQRLELTFQFIEILSDLGANVIMPPYNWYEMNPEEYANTFMEHASSVHISPEHYRRLGWDS